jgi:hypothetical protein
MILTHRSFRVFTFGLMSSNLRIYVLITWRYEKLSKRHIDGLSVDMVASYFIDIFDRDHGVDTGLH